MLSDHQYDLLFESINARKFFESTIQIRCPQCDKSFVTVDQLLVHATEHRKRYCELCISMKSCLISELEMFTTTEYHQHRVRKHVKCRFCEIRFYDDSHLIKHVKEAHFLCDICHRTRGYVAYITQVELLHHYAKDHHMCQLCHGNDNINVFQSEYALKSHNVTAHSHSLVEEGLINVSFGNRNSQQYRDRKNRDSQQCTSEDIEKSAVAMPTVNSEQEFPRLGAPLTAIGDKKKTENQSQFTDDNDCRSAFTPTESGYTQPPKQQQPQQKKQSMKVAAPGKWENMSNRIFGNPGSTDFPALSTVPRPIEIVPNFALLKTIKQNKASQPMPRYPMKNSNGDFPQFGGNVGVNIPLKRSIGVWDRNDINALSKNVSEQKKKPKQQQQRRVAETTEAEKHIRPLPPMQPSPNQQYSLKKSNDHFPQLTGDSGTHRQVVASNDIGPELGAWTQNSSKVMSGLSNNDARTTNVTNNRKKGKISQKESRRQQLNK